VGYFLSPIYHAFMSLACEIDVTFIMNNSKGTSVYDLMETNKEWFYQWLKNN
jgi:hypothetical protein